MRSSSVSRRAFLQVSLVAAAGAAFGLAGCTPRGAVEVASDTTAASDPSTSDGDAEQSTQRAESTGGSAKPLVVYFSYTGNVDKMAHWIADETGGDLVRVLAKDAYPDDYDATVDRAKEEQDNGTHPEIVVELDADQLAGYDTVFFGFPVWWYDLPMPMYTFLENYDLSGKEVIPFFSHGGSSSGANSLPSLESLASGATVRPDDAISIYGDDVQDSEQEVRAWVKGLGYSS
jgi:flavodoxin